MAERLIELTEEEKQALKEAQRMANLLRQEIARAKRAGIDLSTQEQELAKLERQIRMLTQNYT